MDDTSASDAIFPDDGPQMQKMAEAERQIKFPRGFEYHDLWQDGRFAGPLAHLDAAALSVDDPGVNTCDDCCGIVSYDINWDAILCRLCKKVFGRYSGNTYFHVGSIKDALLVERMFRPGETPADVLARLHAEQRTAAPLDLTESAARNISKAFE